MYYIAQNGSVNDINAHSSSPAAAAAWFSNVYERPLASAANLPNREGSAIASYNAGYARGGLIPGMAAGGAVTPASWLNQFKADQASEYGVWAGLYNAFRGHTRGAAGTQLKALAHAQSAEEAGYDRILGGGDTPGNLSLLAGRLRAVAAGARGSALTKAHPGWMKNLGIWVARLLSMATGAAPPFTGTNQFGGPVNPPWNPGSLGPSMNVAGGVQTFDRGGYLRPGAANFYMAYNGTGRNEMAGGGVTVEAHLHVHGPVGSMTELENWWIQVANKTARTGRLNQAVKRAAGSN